VENDYTLKIVNKADHPAQYRVTLADAPSGARLMDVPPRIDAPAGTVISVPLRIVAPASVRDRQAMALEVVAPAQDAVPKPATITQRVESSFFAPAGVPGSETPGAGP
jgi:hypothetical protein